MNANHELEELLGKLCNGNLIPADSDRLVELLCQGVSNRQFYTDYLDAHLTLVDYARRGGDEVVPPLPEPALANGAGPCSPARRPTRWRSLPLHYLAASIVAVALIPAVSLWWSSSRDSGQVQLAQNPVADRGVDTTPTSMTDAIEPLYVAQVADLTADVTWGRTAASQEFLLRVRRGDRIEVASGLVQVDYYSGASIILQGPCAFVPTGNSSGRIEYGNLTGNVTHGDFVLTTPTAKVIDLGTEFGVSVDGVARTDVCVFDGEVRVLAGLHGDDDAASVLLQEGMSARVASGGQIREVPDLEVHRFARELPSSAGGELAEGQVSVVDLFSGSVNHTRRLAGVIAPDTGDSDRHPWLRVDGPGYSVASGYCKTSWHPFVDGVFIPADTGTDICIDSAGTTVDLPPSTGRTWGPIWSRRRIPGTALRASQEDYWGTDTLDGVISRLAECKTGMIGIHANVGVTFDLVEVRKYWGRSANSFATSISNLDNSMKRLPEWSADKRFTADVRVFVDGELRESRLDFGRSDGELQLTAALGESDRFLTVVCTDASQGERSGYDAYDHVVLIDPILTLSAKAAN